MARGEHSLHMADLEGQWSRRHRKLTIERAIYKLCGCYNMAASIRYLCQLQSSRKPDRFGEESLRRRELNCKAEPLSLARGLLDI